MTKVGQKTVGSNAALPMV